MKKFALKASLAIVSTIGLNAAHASDGTITFTGDVITSSCKIDVSTTDTEVKLTKVSGSQLNAVGATAGRRAFKIGIMDCSVAQGQPTQIGMAFELGPSVNQLTGRLTAGTGVDAAKGVEIAILNDKQEPILIGQPDAKSQLVAIGADGKAQLHYSAEYVATATGANFVPGKLNAPLTYSITYP